MTELAWRVLRDRWSWALHCGFYRVRETSSGRFSVTLVVPKTEAGEAFRKQACGCMGFRATCGSLRAAFESVERHVVLHGGHARMAASLAPMTIAARRRMRKLLRSALKRPLGLHEGWLIRRMLLNLRRKKR